MKHAWIRDPDSGTRAMPFEVVRVCVNCGAQQKRESVQEWGRVVGQRWWPLVGRCGKRRREEATVRALTASPAPPTRMETNQMAGPSPQDLPKLKKYTATSAPPFEDGDELRDPVLPDDSGTWVLVSSVLVPGDKNVHHTVVWYWKRKDGY